ARAARCWREAAQRCLEFLIAKMRNDAPFRRSNSKLVGASFLVGRSGATPIAARWARREKSSHCCLADDVGRYVGASPSGKAPVFGSGIRRFESFRPSQSFSDK